MNDTEIITKESKDSSMFGISIRAWLAIMLAACIVGTHLTITIGVVVDAILTKDWSRVGTFANVGEPLYSMATMALAFYFGHKTSK